jgi:hypothetical protein
VSDILRKGKRPLRVLFVHGLESGPSGGKVVGMRELGLEVVAVDMHMSQWRLDKKNSFLRNILRLWQAWMTLFLLLGALPVALLANPWSGVAMGVGAIVWGRIRWKSWVALAISKSLTACVDIQRGALAQQEIDVVVGSSWGGAVCIELLVAAHWSGPTLLLAPAWQKVQERIDPERVPAVYARLQALSAPIRILHAPDDDVVPIAHSERMAGGRIGLTPVPGGGHRLLSTLKDGTLLQAVGALTR